MPRKASETPKVPRVSVRERRLDHPFGAPSVPITIKTPGRWAFYIGDSALRSGNIHNLVQNLGWEFVRPEELDGHPEDLGFRASDGRLVRGEKGNEVLLKMPQRDYDKIQQAKSAYNIKQLGGKQTRDAVAQKTAQEFGGEAGDTVYKSLKVEDERERVELDDERPPLDLVDEPDIA